MSQFNGVIHLEMFINGIEGYSHTDSGNKSEGIILETHKAFMKYN